MKRLRNSKGDDSLKRTVLLNEKQVERAVLGSWVGPDVGIQSNTSRLVPFGKSREDMEVFLRHPDLLGETQPVELCGFSVYSMLRRANTLNEELQDDGPRKPYSDFASKRPILVAFPSEVAWLPKNTAMNAVERSFEDSLPLSSLGFDEVNAKKIARKISNLMATNPKTYAFWTSSTKQKFEGETLSSIMIRGSIATSNLARAKAMSGFVPIVDEGTPGSLALSHRFNLAYSHVIEDLIDTGQRAPVYFYTIALNSTCIKRDTWNSTLEKVVRNSRIALAENIFDGIHLSIRGLSRISLSSGRVNVVWKLMDQLKEATDQSKLPLWWSRPGLAGLAGLDNGVNFASFQINLNQDDIYRDGGPAEELPKFGKIVNTVKREIWHKNQVEAAMKGPDQGMPHLGVIGNAPTSRQLEIPVLYRIYFSKPYNIEAMNALGDDWRRHIGANEMSPGGQYLQSFEAPCNAWGSR